VTARQALSTRRASKGRSILSERRESKDRRVSDRDLLSRAARARAGAYVPYSSYRVGAAVLSADGDVYTGANIENASYGLSQCAERVAIFKAVSDGHRALDTVAVITDDGGPPCGACRQVMAEFGVRRVVIGSARGRSRVRTLKQLLPDAFTPERLLRRP
jgi:cytidine deaminase